MAAITLGFIAAAAAKGILGAAIAGGTTAIIKNLMDKNNGDSFAKKFQDWMYQLGTKIGKNYGEEIKEGWKEEVDNRVTLPNQEQVQTPNQEQVQTPNQEQKPQEPIPGGIVDKTDENVDNQIFGSSTLEEFKNLLNEERQYREEQQKHLEERQDSAYQRAVADLRKAGINPNLLGNISPADSDAGITTSMNLNSSELLTQIQTYSDELQQFIDNNFKGDENAKDRLANMMARWGQSLILTYTMGFKK